MAEFRKVALRTSAARELEALDPRIIPILTAGLATLAGDRPDGVEPLADNIYRWVLEGHTILYSVDAERSSVVVAAIR